MALVGSGEYLPTMEAIDRRLLGAARSDPARVVCIPTAAGLEGQASFDRWAQMGLAHFAGLGARAECAGITDRAAADDPRWAALIEQADLIYFSGGDPLHLYQTLQGTRAWSAVQAACARGAAFAGCSAGAMILGRLVPDVQSPNLDLHPAFGLLPPQFILPHFDRLETYRPGTTALVQTWLTDGQFALGVDENTALIGRPGEEWEVAGAGGAALVTRHAIESIPAGRRLSLPPVAQPAQG